MCREPVTAGVKKAVLLLGMMVAVCGQAVYSGTEKEQRLVWNVELPRPAMILMSGGRHNPIYAHQRDGMSYFGCGLFRLDAHGRPRPDLARRAVAREGGLVWDVALRRGLRLADGSALDAAGFVRLWGRQIPPRGQARWLTSSLALPPEALDAATVRFRLRAPRPDFRRRLSHPWLALMDPRAEPGDRSSLGPFRLARRTSVGAMEVHLVARADHDHGLDLPGDLIFRQQIPGDAVTTYCADDRISAWLVFSAMDGPPPELRRSLAAVVQRLFGGDERLAARSGEPGETRELNLLLPAGDSQLVQIADELQAAALDVGIRLRLKRLGDSVPGDTVLQRRLSSGLYSVALVRMPADIGTALAMEARLAATGLWPSDVHARLDPFLRLLPRRQKGQPYLGLMQPPGTAVMQLPVTPLRLCLRLPAGAPARKILPWLTAIPVDAFRKQAGGVTP